MHGATSSVNSDSEWGGKDHPSFQVRAIKALETFLAIPVGLSLPPRDKKDRRSLLIDVCFRCPPKSNHHRTCRNTTSSIGMRKWNMHASERRVYTSAQFKYSTLRTERCFVFFFFSFFVRYGPTCTSPWCFFFLTGRDQELLIYI